MRKTNRCLSVILAVVMIAGTLPFSVFADPDTALPWDGKTVYDIDMGEIKDATLPLNTPVFFRFRAADGFLGSFLFESPTVHNGNIDEYSEDHQGITLLNEEGAELDRSSTYGRSEALTVLFEKGATYYFRAGVYYPCPEIKDYDESDPLIVPVCVLVDAGESHEHEYDLESTHTVVSKGSCTGIGIEYVICEICGMKVYVGDRRPVHDSFVFGSVVTHPTCTQDGAYSVRCVSCGYEKRYLYDPLGHVDMDLDGYCDDCGEEADIATIEERTDDAGDPDGASFAMRFDYPNRASGCMWFIPAVSGLYHASSAGWSAKAGIPEGNRKLSIVDPDTGETIPENHGFMLTAGKRYSVRITVDSAYYFGVSVQFNHWHDFGDIPTEATDDYTCSRSRTATYICACGKTQEVTEFRNHLDADGDSKCDGCGLELITVTDYNTEFTVAYDPDLNAEANEKLIFVFRPEKDGVYNLLCENMGYFNVYTGDMDEGRWKGRSTPPGIYEAGKTYYIEPDVYYWPPDGETGNRANTFILTCQPAPWEEGSEAEVIAAGGSSAAEIPARACKFYKVTPAEDGIYTFTATEEHDDLVLNLYDADGEKLADNKNPVPGPDDERVYVSVSYRDPLEYTLLAGRTYYYVVAFPWFRDGTINAVLEKTGDVEPTTEPTTEPKTEPTTEPTSDPATEPTTQPVTTTEPTTEPTTATEPTTVPTTEPTTEPTTQPAATTEPTTEPTTQPPTTTEPTTLPAQVFLFSKDGISSQEMPETVKYASKAALTKSELVAAITGVDGNKEAVVTVKDKNGNELADDATPGTGSTVTIAVGDTVVTKTIVVTGDVDGDGQVNASDARLALRAAAKLDELGGAFASAADPDSSDTVNATDARMILRAAAKLDDPSGWLS